MEKGSKVFVNWNGNVLQGEVVENNKPEDVLFSSMIHVRITIQGVQVVAMFTPGHVHATDFIPCQQKQEPKKPKTQPAAEWLAEYRAFLKDHWDVEHNHVQVDYVDEAYKIFRASIGNKKPEAARAESKTTTPAHNAGAIQQTVKHPQAPRKKKQVQAFQLMLEF